MNQLFSRLGLIILAIGFISLIALNQLLFSGVRLDLTENKLYSLSDGTKNILKTIDEPLHLYFFFSAKASENQPQIKNYATQVKELLEEYVLAADEQLILHVIDPEPFSEDEDKASEFGLQAIGKNQSGDDIYFGLVGTNSIDEKELIPFFHPEKQRTLEYDISKLVYRLNLAKKPVIALIDGVSANGGFDPFQRQPKQRWMALEQIDSLFDFKVIEGTATELPEDINTLVLIQPKNLSDALQYEIDQFVLRGGNTVIFSDPMSYIDRMPATAQNPMPKSIPGQDLNSLFNAWGFKLDMDNIVLDGENAMMLNIGGRAAKHLAVISAKTKDLDQEALMLNDLESINFHSAGYLEATSDKVTLKPLISSSENSATVSKSRLEFLPDPTELQKSFVPQNKRYAIAARLEGTFSSAFNDSVADEKKETHLSESSKPSNVIVVADVDMLADMMWVQVQRIFGQSMAQPFANNGDFFFNLMDTMTGSSDLIGLRGRGVFSRPFDVVNNLRYEAEMKFLNKEKELQQQLSETESKLSELQASVNEQGAIVLSPEQQQAITSFQSEKLRIRKELRNVRHQLDRDIEALGTRLTLINTLLVPAILILLSLLMLILRRQSRKSMAQALRQV